MFLFRSKDGGPESSVTGYWLIEAKRLFSVCLLCFDGKSREAYHTHAFNSVSWVLKGKLRETCWDGNEFHAASCQYYKPSFKPIFTSRDNMHKVDSDGRTWVFTLRGPWTKYWKEFRPLEQRFVTLSNGRKEVTA